MHDRRDAARDGAAGRAADAPGRGHRGDRRIRLPATMSKRSTSWPRSARNSAACWASGASRRSASRPLRRTVSARRRSSAKAANSSMRRPSCIRNWAHRCAWLCRKAPRWCRRPRSAALGTTIDVPLGHKDAAFVRSHFDAIEARVPDAPRAGEIVVAVAVTAGGRPLARDRRAAGARDQGRGRPALALRGRTGVRRMAEAATIDRSGKVVIKGIGLLLSGRHRPARRSMPTRSSSTPAGSRPSVGEKDCDTGARRR